MKIGVVGNAACDADSIASAIAFSVLKNSVEVEQYVPFVQCSKADWTSRLDFQCIQRLSGVDAAAQVEFVPSNPLVDEMQEWVLVDHHNLVNSFISGESKIRGIIDHHVVSDMDPLYPGVVEFCDIREIGSSCTIISEMLLAQWDELRLRGNLPLLRMLLFTIVLDTGNLNPAHGRTTPTDTKVVAALKNILQIADYSTDSIYTEMVSAKFDPAFWMTASLDQLIRFDYKQYGARVGIAAVLRPVPGLDFAALE